MKNLLQPWEMEELIVAISRRLEGLMKLTPDETRVFLGSIHKKDLHPQGNAKQTAEFFTPFFLFNVETERSGGVAGFSCVNPALRQFCEEKGVDRPGS